MADIPLSVVNIQTNRETALASDLRFINIAPSFQREYEAWNDRLKVRFIESILLGRATNPIWTVCNDEEESDEVLDGLHRINTALAFLSGQFALDKRYFSTLNSETYDKKFFNQLSGDDKNKVRNYKLTFNTLDSSHRKDLNKLKDMYDILNRSSKTLNDYEFNKVLYQAFYTIISTAKPALLKSGFFSNLKDERGSIDMEIIEILVLSYPVPNSWSSISDMTNQWMTNTVGDTAEKIEQYVKENGESLAVRLVLMSKIAEFFVSHGLVSKDKRTLKAYWLPYKLILARCMALVKNFSTFQRVANDLLQQFKEQITQVDIQQKLECKTKNAQFQKKLICLLDKIISFSVNQPDSARRFSKTMIEEKLKCQDSICPLCNDTIKENDSYEGDHKVPWTAGGTTTLDNLQVVHRRCHQLKN